MGWGGKVFWRCERDNVGVRRVGVSFQDHLAPVPVPCCIAWLWPPQRLSRPSHETFPAEPKNWTTAGTSQGMGIPAHQLASREPGVRCSLPRLPLSRAYRSQLFLSFDRLAGQAFVPMIPT